MSVKGGLKTRRFISLLLLLLLLTLITPAQIVGLDSEPVRDDYQEYLLLRRHIARLLENRHFRASHIIFIPENNLGLESAHLDTMVRDIPEVETFWEKDTRAGVCKTATNTRDYQFLLNHALSQGGLLFDRDLFTVSREQTADSMMATLQDQMMRYHWERKKAVDSMGKDRYTITGKVGNSQDDLLISAMMVVYWGRTISRDPRRLEGRKGGSKGGAGFNMMSLTMGGKK
jgi:hypothetical protein